ncbi:DUF3592 domain-containing protein [Streptomyces broussonetiae]|uniref:DUF3592 domain-containing protein n=1 Tax=Streptomyces broussonetiae TaxID=2686304 RepID=A0A6I6NG36_9ACTN|nr:DUF3592 domain-containing protein [Streptomyces broussonetiae]QHA09130.1 hypothetical protein GQF42_43280 [Streptomyces broussonetiae]
MRKWWLKRYGLHAEGRVFGRETVDQDEDHHTKVTISFSDHNGRQRQIKCLLMTTKAAPDFGTHVPVAYRPGRPDEDRMLAYSWKANVRSGLLLLSVWGFWLMGLIPYFIP